MNATETLWASVLSSVAASIQPEQFQAWFKDVSLLDANPAEATIQVPNAFYSKWFELHYAVLLADAFGAALGARPAIRFEIAPRTLRPRPAEEQEPAAAQAPPADDRGLSLKLNRNYLFSSFVVGPSNQLAHAASLAVVDCPGCSYNPLFLHGGVGLGKTHLMHAVAHALLKKRRDLFIKYVSCESFMNEFIYAIQKGGLEPFRARYRRVDALLVDDIHILARRTRTQEEFFHTFNELYNAHKQIILTSDSAPDDIPTFEERLISRFKWGLVARIDPPCLETRIAIVRKKAELRGRVLPDDVVEFIAQSIPRNIRELEGGVLKTIGYASLMNRTADLALAREILRTEKPPDAQGLITLARIQEAVAGWFGMGAAELAARSRARSVAFPRQVAMYLARQLTRRSLEEIGHAFGGRDHSTVAHACERIERAAAADQQLKATLETLTRQLKTT